MASPQNTSMIIQWITIDGQRVPVALPQFWDALNEKWVIPSETDGLPVTINDLKEIKITNLPELQNVKDVDVKEELELIKQENAEIKQKQQAILDRLEGTFNTQVTGSNVEEQLEILKSLTPNKVEFYSFGKSDVTDHQTLFDSGPGESLTLNSLVVLAKEINRPTLNISYYDSENILHPIRFINQAGVNSDLRADYIGDEGNGYFRVIKSESGNYKFELITPLTLPNGVEIKIRSQAGEETAIMFELLR